jgi:hypothetical protein
VRSPSSPVACSLDFETSNACTQIGGCAVPDRPWWICDRCEEQPTEGRFRIQGVEDSESAAEKAPSTAIERLRELMDTSKRLQTDLDRITVEVDQLRVRIASARTNQDSEVGVEL